jgi:hypothetical protein
MTVQTPTKGAVSYLAIGTAAAETDISSYVKTSASPLSTAKEDTTTYGNGGYESSTPTVAGLVRPFTCLWNPTLDAILAPLLFVEGKSCIWGPASNTTGKPKESGLGYLSKYDRKSDAKGIITADCEFTYSGTITQGVF